MHHYKAPNGTQFNFNSDGSGNVHIYLKGHRRSAKPIKIPISDLVEFIGIFVMVERISELEQRSGHELLGLKPPSWEKENDDG